MIASRRCLANRFKLLLVFVAWCVVVIVGCSKPETEVTVGVEAPASATADEAVRSVLAGWQRQELQALWGFLPPSYRNDAEKLAREFGERLDDKSWGPFVATCRKARLVTSELIVRSSGDANESDNELVARLRGVEQLLDAVCESELSDVAQLRRLDGFRFLHGTGNRLIRAMSHGALGSAGLGGEAFSQFNEVKLSLTESNVASALLSVQWPGQEPTEHTFVRVEDHWVPQTLAEAWPTEFPKVREQCLAWADELRSNPEPWHARLRAIDGLLDELAATKTLAETRQVWQVGASHLAVEWFGGMVIEPSKAADIPIESSQPLKPARVKRPETELLLPDETGK